MAIIAAKKWDAGRALRCRFLDGTTTQHQKVTQKARIWQNFAHVNFEFSDASDAEIRISFRADPGSWSAVGSDALVEAYFPKYAPTMNFGWLRDNTSDEEYERVVLHEFGHVLGCIHEHQAPSANLKWDKPAVYQAFSGPPNYWSKQEIDHNILQRYKETQTQFTKFDPNSIMLYAFPASLFLDGQGTEANTHLSDTDKTFIGILYP
jgi:hypothetical protein